MDFNSRLKKDNAMNEKELREKYISYVNKHNLSPSSLKVYRILFIILATLIILLLGIPVFRIGVQYVGINESPGADPRD